MTANSASPSPSASTAPMVRPSRRPRPPCCTVAPLPSWSSTRTVSQWRAGCARAQRRRCASSR
ncbi:MAG: hypothetical protein FJ301_03600 [Planctomycetes bacterium]|nr:hypothetical protein [Planctomycetota bacterium]